MKYVVLGGYGIIGKAVVRDLFRTTKDDIIIAGRDKEKAQSYAKLFHSSRITARYVDIENQSQLTLLVKGADVVVNCVQYYFNIHIMKCCLQAKTHYVDLGGLFHETRRQLKLNDQFRKINRVAVLGCGSTPGITNVMAAYGAQKIHHFHSIDITFADRDSTHYNQPFVLPYSFKTLIDEYTKAPAVYRQGKLFFAKPGEGVKEYNFGSFGKMRGFYSLHSELATLPSSFKKNGLKNCEFRVTFPEEFNAVIKTLINLGLTSREELNVDGKNTSIIDMTAKVMDQFIPSKVTIKDEELLRVAFDEKLIMSALTKSDGKYPAGVIDTAVPCSIIAQMIPTIEKKGAFPPETIINPILFFRELKRRGIKVFENKREL
ncbi:saccharopine dehydrogenase NADP-binding domain-containing protein [Candidatus Pacearchaeota archaeon]|nr:saccharopine dehydrogenase NADP-binding domain-containing protein [Candidatus Pacearchaeota archaeon]